MYFCMGKDSIDFGPALFCAISRRAHLVPAPRCCPMANGQSSRCSLLDLVKGRIRRILCSKKDLISSTGNLISIFSIHGMYAYGAKDSVGYVKKVLKFTLKGVGDKVTQDMLILAGRDDHLIIPSLIFSSSITLKTEYPASWDDTGAERACPHACIEKTLRKKRDRNGQGGQAEEIIKHKHLLEFI